VETVVLELGTYYPVIEPISASRRERDFRPQRQRRKCRVFADGDPRTETRPDSKSPYSGAKMRQGRTKFEPWRLGGGVRSHMRTRLDRKFPIIREFNREFGLFSPLLARLRRISKAT
jgi:hypothetical protein